MRGNFPPPGDPLHSGIKLISSVSPVLLADSSPSEPSWKPLLHEQCKEAEENNRMGKTRDLFKKTGEIKGTFPAKMGTMKDRSCKELTEEIKKSKALFSLSLSLSPTQWGDLFTSLGRRALTPQRWIFLLLSK